MRSPAADAIMRQVLASFSCGALNISKARAFAQTETQACTNSLGHPHEATVAKIPPPPPRSPPPIKNRLTPARMFFGPNFYCTVLTEKCGPSTGAPNRYCNARTVEAAASCCMPLQAAITVLAQAAPGCYCTSCSCWGLQNRSCCKKCDWETKVPCPMLRYRTLSVRLN